jgi:hypothetical protein
MELRARLALAPDQLPEPPLQDRRTRALATVGRFGTLAALAGAGTYVFLWVTSPPSAPAQPQGALLVAESDLSPIAVTTNLILKTDRAMQVAPQAQGTAAPFTAADYARDLTTGAGSTTAVLAAPPTMIGPAVSPENAAPPAADATITASATTPTSAHSGLDSDAITALVARGRTYIAAGDVAAARLVLRRAAEAGDSRAALALGSTYDPIALARLGVFSFAADLSQAREWYRKAAELGSADAPQRLEQLARTDR